MSKPEIYGGKINQGRLSQEICSGEASLAVERIEANAELPPEPRPTIYYILGGLANDQYQSKQ